MTNKAKVTTGFIGGTILGLSIGFLFAPKKGSKTRTILSEKTKDFSDSVAKNYDSVKDKFGLNKKDATENAVKA